MQKQFDFLETNPDYAICFHKAKVLNTTDFQFPDINQSTKETTTLADLVRGNYIHTPTVLFRKPKKIPHWLKNVYPGDWPLHIVNAMTGALKFFPDEMAVYRVHEKGVNSTKGFVMERFINCYKLVSHHLIHNGFPEEGKNLYRPAYNFCDELIFNNQKNKSLWQRTKLIFHYGSAKQKRIFLIRAILKK